MKSIIISGADGFVGRHLTAYFDAKGYEVYAITIPNSSDMFHISKLQNVKIIEEDLMHPNNLANQLPFGADALIHLAWSGVSPEKRASTFEQVKNVKMALNSVRIAHSVHANRFLFPGSTSEYSYCGQLINEKACPSPLNAYGAAKVSARYLCEALCKELSVPFIYTVITGIYGADRNDNNVITYAIRTLLKGEKPKFTKLEQLWDYVHIDDVTKALFLAATKGHDGAFYSIGYGDNWPLRRYIEIIHEEIDSSLPLGIGEIPYLSEELPSSCIDLTSIHQDTGFVPTIPFQTGIKDVIQSMRLEMRDSE